MSKRVVITVIAVPALGLALAAIIAFSARPRSTAALLARAARVLDSSRWKSFDSGGYEWLSADELLVYRKEIRDGTRFFVPTRLNVSTGREERLRVARTYATYRGYGLPFRSKLSPDRQSLVWWGNYGHTYIGKLDGTRFRSWKGWEQETHWLDDRRVVVLPYARTGTWIAVIHAADGETPSIQKQLRIATSDKVLAAEDGRLLNIQPAMSGGSASLTVAEQSILDPGKQPRTCFVNWTDLRGIMDIAVPYTGDRLAAVVRGTQVSPVQRLLQKITAIQPSYTVEIRTCRLDGSDLRVLGSIPESAVTANASSLVITNDQFPMELRWLPDGNGLSFVYKGALWTIPAK